MEVMPGKMNRYCKGLYLIILVCLITSAAYPQKKPKWLKDPSLAIDVNACAYAMATGKSELEARNQALEILSGNISSSVSAAFRSDKKITEGKEQGGKNETGTYGQIDETTTSVIDVKSESRLFNISVKYFTEKKGTVHALAWFPKEETKAVCLTMINDNNMIINDMLSTNGSLLEEYAGCRKASGIAAENEQLLGLLQVVDPGLSRMADVTRAHEIAGRCDEIANRVTFGIEASGDNKELKTQLAGLISAIGFVVTETEPVYTLQGTIRFHEESHLEGMESVRWQLDLEVLEGDSEVGRYIKKGIQDHQSAELARETVYGKLVGLILDDPEAMNRLFRLSLTQIK